MQSSNTEQRDIVDHIHHWRRDLVHIRKSGKKMDPFHILLTGRASTGKSHVIKAILNMARRELQTLSK